MDLALNNLQRLIYHKTQTPTHPSCSSHLVVIILMSFFIVKRSPCGIIVKVLDCSLKVSEFKLQSCYYIHFQTNTLRKSLNSPLPSSNGLKSIIAVLLQRWPHDNPRIPLNLILWIIITCLFIFMFIESTLSQHLTRNVVSHLGIETWPGGEISVPLLTHSLGQIWG